MTIGSYFYQSTFTNKYDIPIDAILQYDTAFNSEIVLIMLTMIINFETKIVVVFNLEIGNNHLMFVVSC